MYPSQSFCSSKCWTLKGMFRVPKDPQHNDNTLSLSKTTILGPSFSFSQSNKCSFFSSLTVTQLLVLQSCKIGSEERNTQVTTGDDSDLLQDGKASAGGRRSQGETKQPVWVRNILLHGCSELVVPFRVDNRASDAAPYCQQADSNHFTWSAAREEDVANEEVYTKTFTWALSKHPSASNNMRPWPWGFKDTDSVVNFPWFISNDINATCFIHIICCLPFSRSRKHSMHPPAAAVPGPSDTF